jgi:hypothetical protein
MKDLRWLDDSKNKASLGAGYPAPPGCETKYLMHLFGIT